MTGGARTDRITSNPQAREQRILFAVDSGGEILLRPWLYFALLPLRLVKE